MEARIQVLSRSYLSVSHLSAACLFTQRAEEIERTFDASLDNTNRLHREHRANVMATIMLSSAFLEATINEIFSDCADNHRGQHNFPSGKLMGEMWKQKIPKTAGYTIAEKYNIALVLSGKEPLSESTNPLLIDPVKSNVKITW